MARPCPAARRAAVALLALALSGAPVAAAAEEEAEADPDREYRRHPLVPDQAKVQLAGAIGLLSAGGGWAFLDRRLELDLLAGWVPGGRVGRNHDFYTATAKVTWLPWTRALPSRWRVRPLTLALGLTHTFGSHFFVRQPDRYPSGYHPLPSALHATIAAGATVGRDSGALAPFSAYAEVVAADLSLGWWLRDEVVRASDVFSVAVGLRWQP